MQIENILLIVILASLATYLWRGVGVLVASRVEAGGQLFEWLNCVAYALLAGLMARVVFMPVGLLEQTSMLQRGVAMLAGFVVFLASGRRYFIATLVATGAFFVLVRWL